MQFQSITAIKKPKEQLVQMVQPTTLSHALLFWVKNKAVPYNWHWHLHNTLPAML